MMNTERLALSAVSAADAPEVHDSLASDFEVIRHTGSWIWPAKPAFTALKCADGFGHQGGWLVARHDGQLIGMIGLQADGDFGYMLTRAAWGQGFATEMGRAVLAHAAASPHWGALKACVFEDNPASARVLEKLGFVEGAACSGHCASRGGDFPIRTFTLALARA